MNQIARFTSFLLFSALSLSALTDEMKSVQIVVDTGARQQRIDGFGVNVTPAQWRGGNLRSALDLLVDDLGATLIRFDCYGRADWLDPKKLQPDGTFPAEYLRSVYTQPVFSDAWATFRYLNGKGIEPILNVSGHIPPSWGKDKGTLGTRLTNFEAYAEMVVSLLRWAREKEQLKFSLFMPFNESDFGRVEGPIIDVADIVTATEAVRRRMLSNGLGDVRLIVMDDTHPMIERIEPFLRTAALKPVIRAFGWHTYGNGLYEDNRASWFQLESFAAQIRKAVDQSTYRGTSLWLTEYGDLDQTDGIEFTFAWLSTRRLLYFLNDGGNAGIAWDAFDNYHVHDEAWAKYGLLHTDQSGWTYTPKRRYFAAKQVYRFVRPGFWRVKSEAPAPRPDFVFAEWTNLGRHVQTAAFVSEDHRQFTLVGMNNLEGKTELVFRLNGLNPNIRSLRLFCTTREEDCRDCGEVPVQDGRVKIELPERTIFTLTTL